MKVFTQPVRVPTAVDLFSGAGGLSLGLKQAGFRIMAAVDNDKDSCGTYRANHRGVNLLAEDIETVTGERLVGKGAQITLLAGCPPCQGFTRLNELSERQDPRNKLIFEYLRLVRELKPLVVLFENVPGLLRNGQWYFNRLRGALTKEGYRVNFRVLQMADHGVPQRRRRVIVLCGYGFELGFPDPTHARSVNGKNRSSLKRWMPVRDALCGVGRAKMYSRYRRERFDPSPGWHVYRALGNELRDRLRATPLSGGGRDDWPSRYELECHTTTDGFHDVYGRLRWTAPSVTITGGCTNLSKGRFGHPELLRSITAREAALLQGFPKDYEFHARGIESVSQQIGNALPPPFARVMGGHILAQLRAKGFVFDRA